MTNATNLNRYSCDTCKKSIITIDREKGTTPMFLKCRATPNCFGQMSSAMYRGVSGQPTFEWRKPTPEEYKAMSKPMKQHIDMGGLALYAIEEPKTEEAPRFSLFGLPVQAIAGPGFVERMNANPKYWEKPEFRVLLGFTWKENPFLPDFMGVLIVGEAMPLKFSLYDLGKAAQDPPRVFVFDERTDEEKAATPVPGDRRDLEEV